VAAAVTAFTVIPRVQYSEYSSSFCVDGLMCVLCCIIKIETLRTGGAVQ